MHAFGWIHVEFLLTGALWTVVLWAIACAGGGAIGFVAALCRVSASAAVRAGAIAYIQLVQGTPLLVLLFIFYFGFGLVGLQNPPPLFAASLGLVIYTSAFLAEIWRSAVQTVPRAQWEAAECLALSRWQRMRLVVIPQARRIALAPTVGFLVQIVKNTSLASVVGFVELAQAAKLINNSTFQPFKAFLAVAVIYFLICYPISWASRKLENMLNVSHR